MRVATAVLTLAALLGGAMAAESPPQKMPLEMTEHDLKARQAAHEKLGEKMRAKVRN